MKIFNYMNNTNSIMEKILIKYRKEIVRQTKTYSGAISEAFDF